MDDEWKNKPVFVQLKSGRRYSGRIKSIDNAGNGLIFILFIDKFKQRILFAESEIEVIEEERE
jgi:small nuclear ribonucleoprotein (snRNP)-like protein